MNVVKSLNVFIWFSLLAMPALAVTDEEFEALKRQVEANTNAISQAEFLALKRQVEANTAAINGSQPAPTDGAEINGSFGQDDFQALQEQVAANSAAVKKSDWSQRVKLKGDLRYRYQNDDFSDDDGERDRQRIRARAEIVAEATENVTVGVGIATGSEDPVSSNQTIGDFGSSKNINLDLAYFDWKLADGLVVGGGKFKNVMYQPAKSQLIWDGDYRPEGLNLRYKNGEWFVNSIATWLESENDKRDLSDIDRTVFGAIAQTGLQTQIGETDVTVGLGYSTFNTSGKPCFDGGDCGQNADLGGGIYMYDYNVLDLFADATFAVADRPLTIWGHVIKNSDADSEDSGVQVGAQYGKAKAQGSWQAKVYYQDIENDATLSFLTNSDFGGGGTGRKGYYFGGKYALNDATTAGFSYYHAEQTDSLLDIDADTLQLDLVFKYK